jgi:hypothetical protein
VAEERDERSVQVVHASPGRLRLRVPRGALSNGALHDAERTLTGLPGVREVRPNPLASSLLVRYDHSVVDAPALLAALVGAGLILPEESAAQTAPADPSGSAMARAVEAFFGSADERVTRLTGGAADLRALVPLGFAVLAAREILAGRLGAAPWYTLAWWAFDSFVKLHVPQQHRRPPPDVR